MRKTLNCWQIIIQRTVLRAESRAKQLKCVYLFYNTPPWLKRTLCGTEATIMTARRVITTSNHAIILLKSDDGLALNLMLIMVNLTKVLKSLDTMCMLIVSTIPLTILTPRRVCNIYSCSNWNWYWRIDWWRCSRRRNY